MPAGRPSDFTQEIADRICEQLVEGKSLRTICSADDTPHIATVMRWLAKEENAEFREQYARARDEQADTLFDECLSIADKFDYEKDALNPETVQRAKLRIDTRKWMAGKLRPKKYGEKLQHTGADGEGPVQQVNIVRFTDAPE